MAYSSLRFKADPTADTLDWSLVKTCLILLTGAMAALLDTTMVSVTLPELSREFRTSPAALQLVSTAYLLAMAIVVPLVGWLVERLGARAAWMLAIGVFLAGSLLCGAAWSTGSLVAFRAVQGAGGGLILPLMQAILADSAGPRRFGRAMSLVAIPGQFAPILGPVLGGAVAAGLGWRWIFYINLPISLAALALSWRALPGGSRAKTRPFDLVGFALLSPGLAALIYGLSVAAESGSFTVLPAAAWLAGGGLLVAGFAASALRKRGAALIDLRLLRRPSFAAAACLSFLAGVAIFGAMSSPSTSSGLWERRRLRPAPSLLPRGSARCLPSPWQAGGATGPGLARSSSQG